MKTNLQMREKTSNKIKVLFCLKVDKDSSSQTRKFSQFREMSHMVKNVADDIDRRWNFHIGNGQHSEQCVCAFFSI